MIAKNDNSVIVKNVLGRNPPVTTSAISGRCIAWPNSATGPSNMTKVTNTPTATKAISLMSDSPAIANINPS